ncbi:MAG: hypothetical protein K5893_11435 [Prevotella sp.]|nr:hypothetical protein [Prevotella sp.]
MRSLLLTIGKGKGLSLVAKRLFAITIALVAFTSGMKLMAKEAYAVYTSSNNTLTF